MQPRTLLSWCRARFVGRDADALVEVDRAWCPTKIDTSMAHGSSARKKWMTRHVELERSTELKSKKALERRTEIKPRNDKRRKKSYERNYGDRADAIREMPCLVFEVLEGASNCGGRVHAAHTRARGMGGVKGDRREQVPLCAHHHEEAGEARTSKRRAFEERYGLSLDAHAERIARLLDACGYE